MRRLVLEIWTRVMQRCLCWLTWVWIWFICHFLITTPFPILSYKAKTLKINKEDATQELTVIYILLFKNILQLWITSSSFFLFHGLISRTCQISIYAHFLLRSASLSADCYGYESYVTALIFTSTGLWEKHLHCIFELWIWFSEIVMHTVFDQNVFCIWLINFDW